VCERVWRSQGSLSHHSIWNCSGVSQRFWLSMEVQHLARLHRLRSLYLRLQQNFRLPPVQFQMLKRLLDSDHCTCVCN